MLRQLYTAFVRSKMLCVAKIWSSTANTHLNKLKPRIHHWKFSWAVPKLHPYNPWKLSCTLNQLHFVESNIWYKGLKLLTLSSPVSAVITEKWNVLHVHLSTVRHYLFQHFCQIRFLRWFKLWIVFFLRLSIHQISDQLCQMAFPKKDPSFAIDSRSRNYQWTL